MSDPNKQTGLQTIIVSRPGIMQQSLRAILKDYPEFVIIATAGDGLTALNRVVQHQPKLLIIDSNLLDEEIEALLTAVSVKSPAIRCLVFTQSPRRQARLQDSGAHAVLLRDGSYQQFSSTLERFRQADFPDWKAKHNL